MKGIILAGGSGTRLYPLTLVTSKQLLPVYDKPMIYYPLSVLMLANIRDILIISTPSDLPRFRELLGDGSKFGISLSYEEQEKPEGLAQAFVIGEKFIGDDACALVLGDNIFFGTGLMEHLQNSVKRAELENKSTIYGYYVKDPRRYGVIELAEDNTPLHIEEKPENPKSNYCVTGLYFYPNDVVKMAKNVKKSQRGEYEITTLNNMYLDQKRTHITLLGRGYAWLDTGTYESLNDASNYVRNVEKHQGILMCCPEEIAYINKWINKEQLNKIINSLGKTEYAEHLKNVVDAKILYAKSVFKES